MENKSLEEKMVKLFSEMQRKILYKEFPFEEYPVELIDNRSYIKYFMKYYDEIDEKLKNKFLISEIKYFNKDLRYRLLRDYEPFPKEITQEISNNREEVIKWLKENKGDEDYFRKKERSKSVVQIKINVNSILKKVFAANKPEYKFNEGYSFKGETKFSKKIANGNRIYILIERGSIISKLHFNFGFEKPLLQIDFSLLYPNAYTQGFKFDSAENLEENLYKFLKICDVILPYLEENIPKV